MKPLVSWAKMMSINGSFRMCSKGVDHDDIIITHEKAYTVQQIENHGNKHWAHYAGLVESDEGWKTVYSVWLYQVKFSGYPNF